MLCDVSEDEDTGVQRSTQKFFRSDAWDTSGHTWQPSAQHVDNMRGHMPLNVETTPHHQYFATPTTAQAPPSPPPPPPPPPPAIPAPLSPATALRDHISSNAMFSPTDKNSHSGVSPAVCFSLADGLRNSQGKAGTMFAKRRERVDKYVLADDRTDCSVTLNTKTANKLAQNLQSDYAAHTGRTPPASQTTPHKPRLQQMIDIDRAKMSPWDAAVASNGACIDDAFSHIDDYERKRNLANMGVPVALVTRDHVISPVSHAPAPATPVQGRMPEGVKKIKGWASCGKFCGQICVL